MAWNNGLERKKFDEEQKRLAAEYRSAGMTEEQIEQMHQFDLEVFNSRRRFFEHNQQFPELPNDIDEEDGFSPIFAKFTEGLSADMNMSGFKDRYWWIEEIDNEQLAKKLKSLPIAEIELITQYVFEEKTQVEIAKQIGVSNVAVFKRIEKLKNFLNLVKIRPFSSATN